MWFWPTVFSGTQFPSVLKEGYELDIIEASENAKTQELWGSFHEHVCIREEKESEVPISVGYDNSFF